MTTPQRYTCRWLGDDDLGWDDWVTSEELSLECCDVVEATSHKAAARAFLARGRAEAGAEEPWLTNTRIGVRLRPQVQIIALADALEPPAKGRGGTAYEVLALRHDGDDELFGSRRGPDAWTGRYLSARDAVADFRAQNRQHDADQFAVRRAPGAVKLFYAATDDGDQVIAGNTSDLNVVDSAF